MPEFVLKTARDNLTPPPLTPVLEAAEEAQIGPDGVDWVSIQFMMFLELSRQRGRGQAMNPLSFTDIEAYQRLNKVELHPVEMNNILVLDRIFLDFVSEMSEQQIAQAKKAA